MARRAAHLAGQSYIKVISSMQGQQVVAEQRQAVQDRQVNALPDHRLRQVAREAMDRLVLQGPPRGLMNMRGRR